jgi:phosphopantothenoylcysteine decarboxylase/phosphopantothenate--cysteine ligase
MSHRVLLGVTGSAAAFKGVALASILAKKGYSVDPVLTAAGARFVGPAQLSSVTGRRTWTEMFGEPGDHMPHITLSESAHILVVAPATADIIARMALGMADGLLPALALAFSGPVVVAPSMNSRMWESKPTMENVGRLRSRGVVFAGPSKGRLACGDSGTGRMMEPEEVAEIVDRELGRM